MYQEAGWGGDHTIGLAPHWSEQQWKVQEAEAGVAEAAHPGPPASTKERGGRAFRAALSSKAQEHTALEPEGCSTLLVTRQRGALQFGTAETSSASLLPSC